MRCTTGVETKGFHHLSIMFGNNSSKNGSSSKTPTSNPGRSGVNTIDAKTRIDGNIKAEGNIRIDGTLVGNLDCGGLLVIGPKGTITGDVVCQKAIVEGSFEGNLLVKDDLTLEAAAQVTGDVKAQKMAVLGGAKVSGTCTVPHTGSTMGKAPTNGKIENPLKKQASATA